MEGDTVVVIITGIQSQHYTTMHATAYSILFKVCCQGRDWLVNQPISCGWATCAYYIAETVWICHFSFFVSVDVKEHHFYVCIVLSQEEK